MPPLLPSFFISHGGGPWPYMEGEFRDKFKQLEASLQELPRLLSEQPKAVLMISAHWQTNEFSVMSSQSPVMIYDYSGFPQHTYEVQYPAAGSPQLAAQVKKLIVDAGFPVQLDTRQGFDHGTFAPMAVIYPKADIPVVQLSIREDFDPATHLTIGKALAPLREQGILIIGSGLSYHNLRQFGPAARESSKAFDDWLQKVLCNSSAKERLNKLTNWEQAPFARQVHPNEDHLIPLLIAVGAGEEEAGQCIYHEEEFFSGISVSGFRFG